MNCAFKFLRGLAVLLSVSAAMTVRATDAVWNDTSLARAYWTNETYWVSSAGLPLDAAPTRLEDTATFPDGTFVRSVAFGNKKAAAAAACSDAGIGAVTGDDHTTMLFYENGNSYSSSYPERTLTIGDLSLFGGWLELLSPKAVLAFSSESPKHLVRHFSANARPVVLVPDGLSAEIEDLNGVGGLVKRGAGSLTVGPTASGRDRFYVKEGSLTFSAPDESATVAAALAKAKFHLDASRAETLTLGATDADGRTVVSRWDDVRGNGLFAAEIPSTDAKGKACGANPPFIVATSKSPTGRPFVDFGSQYNDGYDSTTGLGKYGPTNCVMRFSERMTFREAIYVSERPNDINATTVLGDSDYYPLHAGGESLFHPSYSFSRMGEPDVRLNGVRVAKDYKQSENSPSIYRLCVIDAAGENADYLYLLGCDRYGPTKTGGVRIGEVILFEEPLTDAERQAVARHLNRKWMGYAAKDGAVPHETAGAVLFADSCNEIGVTQGSVARVRQIVLSTNVLVKTGGGVLRVGKVTAPDGLVVKVQGGSVEFGEATVRPDGATPPDNPRLWLDAASNVVASTGYPDYVQRWNDVRDAGTMYATCNSNVPPRMPTVVRNACRSLPAIDFGLSATTKSSMLFSDQGTYTYAAFMVIRPKDKTFTQGYNLFGSTTAEFYRGTPLNANALHSSGFCSPQTMRSAWSVNGVPVDPRDTCAEMGQMNDFFVVGISGHAPMSINQLFLDRKSASNAGGFQLGEYLLYDRELSESETAAAEAYLMKKWLGKDHPLAETNAACARIEFASDADLTLDSEDGLFARRLSGGNGTVVKAGRGTATVTVNAGEIKAFDVRSGVLKVSEQLPDDTAAFHFDASDAGTLTTEVVEDGARTNVAVWADVRRNGLVATSTHVAYAGKTDYLSAVTNPTLKAIDVNGVSRLAVHCGTKAQNAAAKTSETYRVEHPAASLVFSDTGKTVRELFTVFADNREYGKYTAGFIGGVIKGGGLNWYRNSTAIYCTTTINTDGYVALDGVETPWTTAYPTGVHVISLGKTVDAAVSAICQDRNVFTGGGSFCEQIGFPAEMTQDERTKVEKYLMAKWLTAPNGVNVAADMDFSFRFDADGNVGRMEFDGFLDFSQGAVFQLSAENARKVAPGRYPLLTVSELRNPTAVTLDVDSDLLARKSFSVELCGDTYWLTVERLGCLLIVR